MYQRALAGCEKALGPDHSSTLETVNSLGLLYSDQGKLKEADEMYQRALAGYEKALGLDHPSTLDTVNNLGRLYQALGKLKEAEESPGSSSRWDPTTCRDVECLNHCRREIVPNTP
jgi:tetratricopeptide (TPR) repeat protein